MDPKDPQDNSNYFWAAERWIILQILQPISHATQRLCGLNCFHIAYMIMGLALVNAIYAGCLCASYLTTSRLLANIIHLFVVGQAVYRLLSAEKNCLQRIERDAWRALENGNMNAFLLVPRLSFCFVVPRTVILLSLILNTNIALWCIIVEYSFIPLYWLSMAYAACTPLPRDPSLLSKALQKGWNKIKKVQVSGAGEPASNPT